MAGYLADKGLRILRNGYNIIPIKQGEKRPAIHGWQRIQTKPADVVKWQRNGHAFDGIGITTGEIVFVDLDTPDRPVAEHMQEHIFDKIAWAPVRIGNDPKRGLMFRTETPFRKITSKTYIDEEGRDTRVEILGIGQQFVSHHIHPDTNKPYMWMGINDNPEFVAKADLPVITEAECREIIIVEFERVAVEHGWKVKAKAATDTALPAPISSRYGTTLDELSLGTDPLGLSDEELTAKVMAIPNNDCDYGDDDNTEELGWLRIMAAIHHETGGNEFGRSLAYEWSTLSTKHTDERFETSWDSFGRGEGRPLTARYILRWAKVYEKIAIEAQLADVLLSMDTADNLTELKTAAAEAKRLDVDMIDRGRLIVSLQRNGRRFGVTIGIRDARELVRYEPDKVEAPDWLKGWVYLKHATEFYDRETGERIGREAFDNAFGRYTGDSASKFALDIVKIPIYHMTIYLPGESEIFTDSSGLEWINTYRDTAPKMPAKMTEQDRHDIDIVRNHFRHLFEDDRERRLLISTLAYIVQTGKRVNWMTIIQGAEAIGKTFFAQMMAAVLGGSPHVYKVDTETIVEGKYSGWAEGHQLIFIEELKVHGHRYDVLNKMKAYISDDAISVQEKYVKQYNAINTASYMAFTNFRDVLPLGESDTRYFILLSRWQSADEVAKFKFANPDYYPNLFNSIQQSPGAIRGWLKFYKLHPDFNPIGRAPIGGGKARLIEEAKSELQIQIEDLIDANSIAGISRDLIVFHSLVEALAEDGLVPTPEGVRAILQRLQYTPCLGRRVKMTNPSIDFYCWSKNPEIISAGKPTLRKMIIDRVIEGNL